MKKSGKIGKNQEKLGKIEKNGKKLEKNRTCIRQIGPV
jgi:hypothetical protein